MSGKMLKRTVTVTADQSRSSRVNNKFSASKSNRGGVAGKLRRVQVGSARNDVHQITVPITTATAAGAAQIYYLSAIGEGDDFDNRNGRTAKLLSLKLRGTVQTTSTGSSWRFIIFMDRQSTGVAPTSAQVLRTGTSAEDPINNDNSERFVILSDTYRAASTQGGQYPEAPLYAGIDKYISLKGVVAKYQGTTAAIGGCGSNNIFALLISAASILTPAMQSSIQFLD